MVTFGSLFSGIGGLDLGLERAGMQCVWQCEIDDYANKRLAKHWPKVKRYGDITKVDWSKAEKPDLICGGFPCQDISQQNIKGKGIKGAKSGLWAEYYRCIRKIRPKFVLVENVAALLFRGVERVLGDLARVGLDAEWEMFSAGSFGAPQRRKRLFILAYPAGQRWHEAQILKTAIAEGIAKKSETRVRQWPGRHEHLVSHGGRVRWVPHFEFLRMDDGPSIGLDERQGYKQCGNAVVPEVAELIGQAIMQANQPPPP